MTVDRDDDTWIADLTGKNGKDRQDRAWQELGDYLVRFVRWYLTRRAALPPDLIGTSSRELDQLAHDIVQDALLRIWQRGLRLYQGRARFPNFAKAIATNQARQVLRSRWRHPYEPLSTPDDDERDDLEEARLSLRDRFVSQVLPRCPEQLVVCNEVFELVARVLTEQCSDNERQAFIIKYLLGRSSKEIAAQMGVSDNAVNMLTYSARRKLRQALLEAGYTLDDILNALDGSKI